MALAKFTSAQVPALAPAAVGQIRELAACAGAKSGQGLSNFALMRRF